MNRIARSLVAAVVIVGCNGTPTFAQVSGIEQRVATLEAQLAAALDAISALEAANATLQTEVGTLTTRVNEADLAIQALQMGFSLAEPRLIALEANTVLDLDGMLVLDPTGSKAVFQGVNVQVVNGLGNTATTNGRGNLIVGYDEATPFSRGPICSDGEFSDQVTCEQNGEVWASSHKSGSHYLVVGPGNNYSQAGGVVFGVGNTANGMFSTVTGGTVNLARRTSASVSGGGYNDASAELASVSGGLSNTASGDIASVSGGFFNTASGIQSSVTGGWENIADGLFATVSGGHLNRASGGDGSMVPPNGGGASVSGGEQNVADGTNSSVSGGFRRETHNEWEWAAGSLLEPF